MKFKTDRKLEYNADKIVEHLKSYKQDDILIIDIKKQSKSRTVQQNRWYWACIKIIADDLGYEEDEAHYYFRQMFLSGFRYNKLSKKEEPFIGSTTKLSTKQFTVYIEKVRRFAIQRLNISTPTPNLFRITEDLENQFKNNIK